MSETTRDELIDVAGELEELTSEGHGLAFALLGTRIREAVAVHAQAVQRLTEELKLAESAMSKLVAQMADLEEERDVLASWSCDCGSVISGTHDPTCITYTAKFRLSMNGPRPEGST